MGFQSFNFVYRDGSRFSALIIAVTYLIVFKYPTHAFSQKYFDHADGRTYYILVCGNYERSKELFATFYLVLALQECVYFDLYVSAFQLYW